jgi:hypothetical protein
MKHAFSGGSERGILNLIGKPECKRLCGNFRTVLKRILGK